MITRAEKKAIDDTMDDLLLETLKAYQGWDGLTAADLDRLLPQDLKAIRGQLARLTQAGRVHYSIRAVSKFYRVAWTPKQGEQQ